MLTALRLEPGEDLRSRLEAITRERGWRAAYVIAGIGSLKPAALRLADAPDASPLPGPFELLTLCGSLSPDGAHLHASVADASGRVTGGHVVQGCTVRTTAELLVEVLDDLVFERVPDARTGFAELQVRSA
jgi:uncharacterized protein